MVSSPAAEMAQWTRFRHTESFRTVKVEGYEYLFILVWSAVVLMLFRWAPAMFCISTVWVWHFQMGWYRMFTFLWMICSTVDSFSVFLVLIPLCTLLVVLASFPCAGRRWLVMIDDLEVGSVCSQAGARRRRSSWEWSWNPDLNICLQDRSGCCECVW